MHCTIWPVQYDGALLWSVQVMPDSLGWLALWASHETHISDLNCTIYSSGHFQIYWQHPSEFLLGLHICTSLRNVYWGCWPSGNSLSQMIKILTLEMPRPRVTKTIVWSLHCGHFYKPNFLTRSSSSLYGHHIITTTSKIGMAEMKLWNEMEN